MKLIKIGIIKNYSELCPKIKKLKNKKIKNKKIKKQKNKKTKKQKYELIKYRTIPKKGQKSGKWNKIQNSKCYRDYEKKIELIDNNL